MRDGATPDNRPGVHELFERNPHGHDELTPEGSCGFPVEEWIAGDYDDGYRNGTLQRESGGQGIIVRDHDADV
jgi:hypothetical protein